MISRLDLLAMLLAPVPAHLFIGLVGGAFDPARWPQEYWILAIVLAAVAALVLALVFEEMAMRSSAGRRP